MLESRLNILFNIDFLLWALSLEALHNESTVTPFELASVI